MLLLHAIIISCLEYNYTVLIPSFSSLHPLIFYWKGIYTNSYCFTNPTLHLHIVVYIVTCSKFGGGDSQDMSLHGLVQSVSMHIYYVFNVDFATWSAKYFLTFVLCLLSSWQCNKVQGRKWREKAWYIFMTLYHLLLNTFIIASVLSFPAWRTWKCHVSNFQV